MPFLRMLLNHWPQLEASESSPTITGTNNRRAQAFHTPNNGNILAVTANSRTPLGEKYVEAECYKDLLETSIICPQTV